MKFLDIKTDVCTSVMHNTSINIENEVWCVLLDNIWDNVEDDIGNSVFNTVWDNLWDNVENHIPTFIKMNALNVMNGVK